MNLLIVATVASPVDKTVGRSYETDSMVDAAALVIVSIVGASLWRNQNHSPTEFKIPALWVLQHAVCYQNSFLELDGIEVGHTSLVDGPVTCATHFPPSVYRLQ